MTRVAFVTGYPHRFAGANRSMRELMLNLSPEYEPVLFVTAEGVVPEGFRQEGVRTVVVPHPPALNTYGKALIHATTAERAKVLIRDLIPTQVRWVRAFREHGIDIVHANDPRAMMLVAIAARLLRLPTFTHIRGELAFGGALRWLAERAGSRLICVSKAVEASLSPDARSRAVTIYNGTRDVRRAGEGVPRLDALRAEGKVIFLTAATLVPFKGFHHLVDAIRLLRSRGVASNAHFAFIGGEADGHEAYARWLKSRAAGVEGIWFAGWQDDPFRFYRSADVAVLPSVREEELVMDGERLHVLGNEGFPRTHLEAMCHELPLVGTSIAGVPEQIEDGRSGFLVPPSDPSALADAIQKLAADATLRRSMGARGRERVLSDFSTEEYVRRVEGEYARALSR